MSKPPQAEGGGGGESTTRFLRLADRQLRPAYRLAGYLLGSSDEAEDAVQEAILRAWRSWPNLREEDRFAAWFEQIVANVCRDRGQRRSRLRALPLDDEMSVFARDPFRSALDRDEVGRALQALPAEQRAVIVLRFWRDLPLEEIADRLALPLGTVKSRLHYGLRTMRGVIEPAAFAEVSR
jgi:RNA polymerase sigma-70 factor (ECF subfamily)